MEGGDIGPLGHGPADQVHGLTVFALLMAQDPQQVQGIGVVLVTGQDLLIHLPRRLQSARLMHLEGIG